MLILILFAFIGGIVTILSPCILPILPIILSSSATGGKQKPYGIVIGFILSFTFFTLFLTSIVNATGLSADLLRNISVIILILFGLVLLLPSIQAKAEKLFSILANHAPRSSQRHGFGGGIIIGLSLGLLWTPCVGPILAGVISLALTGSVTSSALLITLAYSLGTTMPMLAIMYGGRQLLQKVPWLLNNSSKIQKIFGVIMVITALAIFFNYDRKFQSYILEKFPNYGTILTSLENNDLIKQNLNSIMDTTPKSIEQTEEQKKAPSLIPGGQWLNSQPLSLDELRGKVVLLDFMTYSCINCIRTFPYLQAWHEKYQSQGLAVIGIHTPEFEFEKNPTNVQKALNDFGISFAIMQDNNYATWLAYDNHYWPHTFLINTKGQIVYEHIGEGNYDVTENKIQELLTEANLGSNLDKTNIADKLKADDIQSRSPEVYFGSARNEFLTNGQSQLTGLQSFKAPKEIELNSLYLVGDWLVQSEYASNVSSGAKIIFKYSARKAYIVAGADKELTIKIRQDGQDLKTMLVQEKKLYQLTDNGTLETHTLEIEIPEGSLDAFTFTFG